MDKHYKGQQIRDQVKLLQGRDATEGKKPDDEKKDDEKKDETKKDDKPTEAKTDAN